MTERRVNRGRRRFLVGATGVMGAVGAMGAAVPFVASWQPSARALAAGAPVRVDITKLAPGQQVTVAWRGRPVWLVHRTPAMIERTRGFDPDRLRDPESRAPQQPPYADGPLRAIKPEIGVLVGICTHLGCSPVYRPEPGQPAFGSDWPGGYFCPCHGSKFDLAGRVFTNVPAPLNLEVPPHRYERDSVVVIGEDPEVADG
ncbi:MULTISPECIES: ubiquinol-cytochrome c reductase iron-sulfur subunit [unclassified Modicisalibacter]|uniref:ubiquinol-cytochrome c reductase iron-sulfur subunit n=1 Tax=unclassified Modicisalibacter TaxID=2679913 RepID=UPI001CCB90E4|nr:MULTISPECIES: ubiquinol-cytochrome c reductase iron-sulfur subunit [unclassified Modicisalibacter]MBZ9557171.1 ubiquinol-cytochrome c reductase iron-sulfur subunit [Modicisalibacter sp. R2A 31.J]MBZ9574115.1 ubiquinol-cytochrome c reductase iron-sulfur subunit [Modicisalibacter sp. MOD 31.J]